MTSRVYRLSIRGSHVPVFKKVSFNHALPVTQVVLVVMRSGLQLHRSCRSFRSCLVLPGSATDAIDAIYFTAIGTWFVERL